MIYGYCRVSTEEQATSGVSLEAQESVIRQRASQLGCAKPIIFVDGGVSAYRVPVSRRPEGLKLLGKVRQGDKIIVARMDRMFRRMADYCRVMERLSQIGVALVICDLPFETGTPTGQAMLHMMVAIAEWESGVKGQRTREAIAARRAGVKLGNRPRHREEKGDCPGAFDGLRTAASAKAMKPANEGSRVFVYARVSHESSANSGLSVLAQTEAGYRYACEGRNGCPDKVTQTYTDLAVSAFTKNLRDRPAGRRLFEDAKSGDHVVFARLDRAFRSIHDLSTTAKHWRDRGVIIHFADQNLVLGTPAGDAMLAMMGVFSELESRFISDRTKAAMELLRRKGRVYNRDLPVGWKRENRNGKVYAQLDREELVVIRWAMVLRSRGLTKKEICERIERTLAKRQGRKPISLYGSLANRVGPLPANCTRSKDGKTVWPPYGLEFIHKTLVKNRDYYRDLVRRRREVVMVPQTRPAPQTPHSRSASVVSTASEKAPS